VVITKKAQCFTINTKYIKLGTRAGVTVYDVLFSHFLHQEKIVSINLNFTRRQRNCTTYLCVAADKHILFLWSLNRQSLKKSQQQGASPYNRL
jgi:hypothetical protein